MRPLETVRAAYGTVELLAPGAVEHLLLGHRPDERARTVIRILGARHLLQALVTARGGPALHRLGGGVDIVHAVTMAALAGADPKRRRAAAINAAIALVFAAGELR
ncbi:hypothetical protein SCMU_01160 [Sinomonas cyclohexanicum]|uniref:Uncharacterized protein n=1 Tax=Sinomonas cyclohexanicum TaxID=322009 RepID=A0ABN6FCF2_SINCY|nr:hypothetical protein [Corynebacterium cyclohexanicum]BCT74274.1 hypothetical protein SCMU_01160 [Corynebacterium cyclohexanicum]